MRGRFTLTPAKLRQSRYWGLIRWPYYAAGVALVFLIFGIFANTIVMPMVTRHGSEFPTPQLIGKSVREAEQLLRAAGLRIDIESRQHSPAIPENVIIDQVPRPRALVKEGRRVKVIVSAGAQMTVVPFLRGYTPRQAELMLEETGLVLGGQTYARDDSLPGGVVVGSIPAAGGSVPIGSAVNIKINEADMHSLVTVPILVGENIKKAEALLDGRGLELGAVYHELDEVLLPGTVVRQSITAGTRVPRGSTIDLTISQEG